MTYNDSITIDIDDTPLSAWLIETSCGLIREVEAYDHLDAIIETQSEGYRTLRCEWRRYI